MNTDHILTPENGDQKLFVWFSTSKSVEDNTFSVFAATEVIVAVFAYWAIAIWLQSQTHLWISIVIAPLLLLRSKASIALGLKWFNEYVDAPLLPAEKAVASSRFWIAAAVSLIVTSFVTNVLSKVFLFGHSTWVTFILAVFVGYIGTQSSLTIETAIAGHEVVSALTRKTIAVVLAAAGIIAIAIGVITSEVGILPAAVVISTTAVLLTTGVIMIPPILSETISRQYEYTADGVSRGVAFGRATVERSPSATIAYAPGILVGGWLRSVGIRLLATVRHPWEGIKALPSNWWRTLFVLDFFCAPEMVPEYRRKDTLNVAHFRNEMKNIADPLQRSIYIVAFIILFVPAYFYRLSIKSTCWFYLPLVYMARPTRLAAKPEVLRDVLWRDPMEWWRRILAVFTVIGVFITSSSDIIRIKALFPIIVVSPLEYIFLIDLSQIKPWQWFNLASAAITLVLLATIGRFKIFLDYSKNDQALAHAAIRYAFLSEYLMRLRVISTGFFLLIAFVHALLWLSPIKTYLPSYILDLLYAFYGSAFPSAGFQ